MMVGAVRAIAGGVLAAETEIGSVGVTDRPFAHMPVKLGHRPDPPRTLELKHDRLSLGACAWRRSQAAWWRGGSADSTGGPDAGWRVAARNPAGKTQAMDLADDGVAGDAAKLFGDLRGAQSPKPQGLQTLDARVGPAGVGHGDDPCCRAPIERTQHGPPFSFPRPANHRNSSRLNYARQATRMAKRPTAKPPARPVAKAPVKEKPAAKPSAAKERITPPKAKLLTRESAKLRKGDPAAGRILAEEAVAVKQGVRKPKKRP
jgi:hypothetical protein